MYILRCSDGTYYTGSTTSLELRFVQHQNGEGANHHRIDEAFYREKQVQGWSRNKKEALINGEHIQLPELAMAYRDIKSLTLASRTSSLASRASANEEVSCA